MYGNVVKEKKVNLGYRRASRRGMVSTPCVHPQPTGDWSHFLSKSKLVFVQNFKLVCVEHAPVISTYHTRYILQFPYLSQNRYAPHPDLFPLVARVRNGNSAYGCCYIYVVFTTAMSSFITSSIIQCMTCDPMTCFQL